MKATLLLPLLAAAAILAGAACGGGGDDTAAPAPSGPPPTSVTIDQDNLKFKPSEARVAVGGSVTFTNSETAWHNVVLNDRDLSGDMKKGDSFTWPATAAGEYRFSCEFHPQMRTTITVVE